MKHIALIAALAATTTPALAELNLNDSCGASRYQTLIGQPAIVADLMAEANLARVLRPDTMTTMIYLPERMNVSVDEHDVITRVYCG
ncbi:I78 family peptidase inhibitor [Nioella aestuarii]|uniref:I78 family peptidase inhibitor n=1 Tax=Nioella aestuarii TaxID=1662864 RepID=UPI003D7F886F